MTFRYTTGTVKLAYQELGTGEPPLVVIPGWVTHLSFDWDTPEIRDFYERLAAQRRMVRYDKRGNGLSDRPSDPDTFALDTRVRDLAAVMDAAGVRRAALLGWSEGGPIAIAFAARYPERVSHLILYGTYARALVAPDYPIGGDPAVADAFLTLVRAEWGRGSRLLAAMFIPEADEARTAWFTAYQRAGVSPHGAVESRAAATALDVRALLSQLQMPILVLHRRRDIVCGVRHAEHLAAQLPHARLEIVEGDHHLPYFGDSGALTDAIDRFLGTTAVPAIPIPAAMPLTPREREVAVLVARGLTNRQIADALVISERTVHTHVSNLLGKLALATRAQVASWVTAHDRSVDDDADHGAARIRLVR